MSNTLKAIAIAITLIAGTTAAGGSALADQGTVYHWAYPESFKSHSNLPLQPFGAESGIPPQYR
jgi:hypothetical protein